MIRNEKLLGGVPVCSLNKQQQSLSKECFEVYAGVVTSSARDYNMKQQQKKHLDDTISFGNFKVIFSVH